ncbi:MAG: hypothetical protein RMJ51_00820 [Candidatus Calescibacterium sp.]|nr:hypothetical protein [Candidatus Calescibacterium sp.]MDW8194775.1 hypothetical protein [Candidatus Calescibacterium sp.]
MRWICWFCGSVNDNQKYTCQVCKRKSMTLWPKQEKQKKITNHYEAIKLTVEKFLSQQISSEEYYKTLDKIQSIIESSLNGIIQTIDSIYQNPTFDEETIQEIEKEFKLKDQIEIGIKGIEMFLEAIEKLKTLPEIFIKLDQNKQEENLINQINETKEYALKLAYEATEYLNIALEMALRNINTKLYHPNPN